MLFLREYKLESWDQKVSYMQHRKKTKDFIRDKSNFLSYLIPDKLVYNNPKTSHMNLSFTNIIIKIHTLDKF